MDELFTSEQQPIKVMVATTNESLVKALEAFLSGKRETRWSGHVRRNSECLERLDDLEPDVLLLEEGLGGSRAVELARDVKIRRPKTAVFTMVQGEEYGNAEYHRQLMNTNVSGVFELTEPYNFQKWIQPMRDAVELLSKIPDKEGLKLGEVIAVHSLKGGVGRTLISANLSASLTLQNLPTNQKERQVLLVDLNWPFGGLDTFLNLSPAHSILDLLTVMDSLNRQNIQNATAVHLRQNLRVLVSPLANEQVSYLRDVMEEELFYAEYDGITDGLLDDILTDTQIQLDTSNAMRREVLEHVLRKAKAKQAIVQLVRRLLASAPRYYDYVVVDLPPVINEMTLSALRYANQLLLVCTPDVPAIRALRAELELLPSFGIVDDRVKLILNRVRKGSEISSAEVKALFENREWLAELPEEPKLESFVNTSELVVESPRSIPFAVSMRQMATAILNESHMYRKDHLQEIV